MDGSRTAGHPARRWVAARGPDAPSRCGRYGACGPSVRPPTELEVIT